MLNNIRNNSITIEDLSVLNQRFQPDFEPPPQEFYVYMTTTNKLAEEINDKRLAGLKGRLYTFTGSIEGDFGPEYLATRIDLKLKLGAQIMMLNNDVQGRWVNGSIGKITGVSKNKDGEEYIIAELAEGEEVEILPFTWEVFRFFTEAGGLQSEVIGTFTPYPLMLAWAVTIHKGHGKTFDRVIIDIGKGTFAQGQMYIALSRCTTLGGIILKKQVLKKHIWTNYQVMDFLTKYQYRKAELMLSMDDKIEIIRNAIARGTPLEIVYLKPYDEKSARTIRPHEIGEMEYRGKTYPGVRAFCLMRNEERVFRVET
jgi:ATP-dependent DNA helicase PIF1